MVKLWKLRLQKEVAIGTDESQHVNCGAADGEWRKMCVGNKDSKHIKEEIEERDRQIPVDSEEEAMKERKEKSENKKK